MKALQILGSAFRTRKSRIQEMVIVCQNQLQLLEAIRSTSDRHRFLDNTQLENLFKTLQRKRLQAEFESRLAKIATMNQADH